MADMLFLFLMGLSLGSFLTVVVYRLPRSMLREAGEPDTFPLAQPISVVLPRSFCPICGHRLTWYQNIPLLSFALLRGHCAACHGRISWRYPAIELGSLLLVLAAFAFFDNTFQAWMASLFLLVLWALCWIDMEHLLLPDSLTLILLLGGCVMNGLGGALGYGALGFVAWRDALLGCVSGFAILWLIRWGFFYWRGQEGMGLGDAKLLGALGAWLGWRVLPDIVLYASTLTLIWGIGLWFLGRLPAKRQMPFGSALALAGMVCLFWR